jgi:hypothetical protein
VYAVLAVNPVTVIVPEPPVTKVPVPPAGLDVAVYDVAAGTPVNAGAVYVTVAVVDPVAVAVPIVGAPGNANVVIELDAALDALLPALLVAKTVKV